MSHQKVLELVKRRGPILPIEIASELNIDSFLASAYLSDLVKANQIKQSEQRVGSTFLYYVSGQEGKLKSRLDEFSVPIEKTPKEYQTEKIAETPELAEKRSMK